MNLIYIIIFFILSILPVCLFPVTHFYGDKTGVSIEKKETKAFPGIFNENGINTSFDDECEEWLNQNIPFRGAVLTNVNILLSDILRIPTSNVVAGSDDWIYSVETVDDYIDSNSMSKSELQTMGITLSLIQERVQALGGNFLFVPVPNKNSIYPEYMPIRYQKGEESNLDRIYNELESYKVPYANLKAGLLDMKSDLTDSKDDSARLYYKRDTHWTALGAVKGYEAMMNGLGRTPLALNTNEYTSEWSKRGDLDVLLYPEGNQPDEEYIIDNQLDYDSFEFIYPKDVEDTRAQLENFMSDREDHDNNFTTRKRVGEDNSALYMVRDSFARALLPFFINSYDEATFVRSTTPSFENVVAGEDVIYEICERNLRRVTESAPYILAPKREGLELELTTFDSEENICFCVDEGYAYRIYGVIAPDMKGADGRIYVSISGAEGRQIFEAFPIYEEKLISEALENDKFNEMPDEACGYSLYIDKNSLSQGSNSVEIISGNMISSAVAQFDMSEAISGEGEMAEGGSLYKGENANHQLSYRGAYIGIGDNMRALRSALGNQAAPSEIITSCLSGVDATVYYYPNITIETDMEGNIYYISLADNSYSDGTEPATTEAGIGLGDDKAVIWEKLGKPGRENDKNCTYSMEHMLATYSYKNGVVTSVILEDKKYSSYDETAEAEEMEEVPGIEYDKGNAYLFDDEHIVKTGWQIIDGNYYFFDRITGERIVGQTIDGIVIGEDGEVSLSEYDKQKVETMMKANRIVVENTEPSDTMEEKRRKVFDWVLSFPYYRPRQLRSFYKDEGIEIVEANDIFEDGAGDCVSEAAAVAFLFHEIGYNDVYWVHDTGHSWVRCEDHLFDPLFAESRDFEANYDAPFTDYRKMMDHAMLIY